MTRHFSKLVFVALQAAAVATAFAVQHDNGDSRHHDDHGRGGYSHDQKGERRDTESRSSHSGHSYKGSHNNYHDSGPSFSISVVTPGLIASFGTPSFHGSFRSGYWHRRGWRDSQFLFGFYVFDYDTATAAFSPFYYYPSLPGYVALSKVEFTSGSPSFRFDGRVSWDDRGRLDRDAENAIYDLQDAVKRQDKRALGRLVPHGYWVDVDPRVGKRYSMSSDDFYDLMSDMAQATDTTDYRILTVETGRDCARVVVEHDFTDAWQHSLRSYHRVTLDYVGSGYRIAEFETSRRRF